MRSTRDFLTGILTGVAIGILTAPRSGKETREKLVEETNKRSEDLKDQYGKVKEQASQYAEQAKDQFGKVKEQANQYVGQAKEQFSKAEKQGQSEFDANKYQAQADFNDTVEETADRAKSGINSAKESFKID